MQPVAIVTGGGRGVGRGIADKLAASGAYVLVCGRTEPPELPAGVQFVAADVRELADIDRLFDDALRRWGRVDVVVNNAGGSPFVAAAEASPRFSEAIIRLNLIAPLHVATKANAIMQAQDTGGCILNIASVSGTRPSPGTAAYGAAKAGLLNLTRSLAVEWAPRVRVNAITAGMVLTEQSALHYGDDAGIARVAETVPMNRLATPADIGEACVFLASPQASYITGATLEVHGGGERPAFLAAATANRE